MRDRSSHLICVFFVVCVFLSPPLAAQDLTAEEVIRKSIAARGGQENWDALRSLEFSGDYSTFSKKAPFVLRLKRPNSYRLEYQYTGMPVVLGYDGETAWWIDLTFFTQESWPVEAPLVHARVIEGDAEFGGPLLDYDARGHRVELKGKADLDGEDTYLLVVTLANGSVESWHLNTESFLPVARMSRGADLLVEVEQWTYFSDYQEVDGVLFPHLIEIYLGGRYQVIEIEKIKTNAEIEDRLFAMAIPTGMERLRGLTGEWDVKVTGSRPVPAMPFMEGEFSSTIRSSYHGGLLEEEFSYLAFGTPRRVKRLRSYDRFRDVFMITYFDDQTFHMNVLEGRFEDGRLVATNLESGTFWVAKGNTIHNREVIFDIEADSFKVDWDTSTDGGETWNTTLKFVYSRRAGPVSPGAPLGQPRGAGREGSVQSLRNFHQGLSFAS